MRTLITSFPPLLRSVCIASLVIASTTALAGGFPTGSYISGPYTLKFEPNGAFRVTKSGVALVQGTYLVKGNQLQITDKRGPFACTGKGQATATYAWSLLHSVRLKTPAPIELKALPTPGRRSERPMVAYRCGWLFLDVGYAGPWC